MSIFILKSFIFDPIFTVLYFPFWWYGPGLLKRAKGLAKRIKNLSHDLALKIMFINLLRPMFGEYSRSGRIISFFMRCVLLIWRLILFSLGVIFFVLLFLIWIFLPLIAIWQIKGFL
ncbi:hypothetical protein GW896_00625 [Candidatus Kuenenbacteria bacterium]|nr:hypothetical protein [Candidatus Kuenenbacteria bacterium]OIP76651.1 MAG: hypothetical protein AUK09_01320 [Parcubacteria group bacterium CG2_30_36_38]PJC00853.1 MAG: hypothetical protein CO074_00265 [bacterium (Candidatus Moisslbacteria) CG_4_9_14_0_8_um_filter_36_20]